MFHLWNSSIKIVEDRNITSYAYAYTYVKSKYIIIIILNQVSWNNVKILNEDGKSWYWGKNPINGQIPH